MVIHSQQVGEVGSRRRLGFCPWIRERLKGIRGPLTKWPLLFPAQLRALLPALAEETGGARAEGPSARVSQLEGGAGEDPSGGQMPDAGGSACYHWSRKAHE